MKAPLHRTLESLSKTYGSIFLLRLGNRSVVVVSSPEAMEECFTKNDINFANRPQLIAGKHLGYNFTTMALAPYGDHWRNLRRIATLEFFSTNKLNMFMDVRQEEIKSLVKNLYKDSPGKVEMKTRLLDASFNVIMRMVAGKRYFGAQSEDFEEGKHFRDLIREIFDESAVDSPHDFIPFCRWIDYKNLEKRLASQGARNDAFFQSLIDEHRNKNSISKPGAKSKTLIDGMTSLQLSDPQTCSDSIIKGTIFTLLTAGTDTSSVTIEWGMSLLLNHPEVLNKARAEIDTHVGQERFVNESDLPNLPYVQCIVNETMRLFPAGPLLAPHESLHDCTIGGYDIPAGTILFANAWAIHRDPNVWENPTSFKPERFDGWESGTHKFVPFGSGRRQCPGANLANRVVGLALATLVQCFEWERVSEELVELIEAHGFTMPKNKPLEAVCRARPGIIKLLSEL